MDDAQFLPGILYGRGLHPIHRRSGGEAPLRVDVSHGEIHDAHLVHIGTTRFSGVVRPDMIPDVLGHRTLQLRPPRRWQPTVTIIGIPPDPLDDLFTF